ncbi:MAG: UDP-N-acetylmuramate:L-alanyl-gamma-D-glutamyl-meso-diaminopimelate ligase [Pseudomonadota bacterium]
MSTHIYFLGIGGTLMGSLAQLAKELGYRVSGSDHALYPPMSDQLAQAQIEVFEGFAPQQLEPPPDLVVIGNAALPRGHAAVEYILERGIPYTSGAQWLGEAILHQRWVIAVSGTHGKTTTASMLAWILDQAGMQPGYLIGGAPQNLKRSARLGNAPFFVVEADEYDTSYFDRRAKFVHYRPRTLIINNLEYDHADIYPDLQAIQTQFHNLLRTVPEGGLVVAPSTDDNVDEVLQMGAWTPIARVGEQETKRKHEQDNEERWRAANISADGTGFDVMLGEQNIGRIEWNLTGAHNQANALNAIAAARHAGVPTDVAVEALSQFAGVKRRMDVIHRSPGFVIYDDFAHHPTAIRTTLEGLRKQVGSDEIIAVVEPRTHTMSLGTLKHELISCCAAADSALWYRGENIKWDLAEIVHQCVVPSTLFDKHDKLVDAIVKLQDQGETKPDIHKTRHVVIMSNGGFGGIYQTLVERLST